MIRKNTRSCTHGNYMTLLLILDPFYTVPDPQGHDIKLNIIKTSVALKFMIILKNLTTTNHRKSSESKYA